MLYWGCFQIIVFLQKKKNLLDFLLHKSNLYLAYFERAYSLNTVVAHSQLLLLLLLNIVLHQGLFYFDTRNMNWKSNYFEVSATLLF